MPPPQIKTVEDVIYYYYAKLIIASAAQCVGQYGFIIDQYNQLKAGKRKMSDYDREIRKQMESENKCVYCGNDSSVMDHVIPKAINAPDCAHNIVKSCQHCNSSKGDKDLIDWWVNHLKKDKDSLPRIPIGIYLKFSYDWHKINHTLGNPARSLFDLKPFIVCK